MLLVALISVCHSPEGAFLTKAGFLLLALKPFKPTVACVAGADRLESMLLAVANLTLQAYTMNQLESMQKTRNLFCVARMAS